MKTKPSPHEPLFRDYPPAAIFIIALVLYGAFWLLFGFGLGQTWAP